MLTEFRLIRNVGKYENCSGTPCLRQLTLIYAANARGKTTLTAILRSLGENEPVYIMNRHRLGTTNQPEIQIIASQGSHVFQNGAWDTHCPDLLVFDDHFIEANVYSGLAIGRDQRIGLHEVILGSQSVSLVREIEQVISDITSVNSQIRQAQADIQAHVHGLPIDEFVALDDLPDAEQQIHTHQSLLHQIQQAEPIRQQAVFDEIDLPEFRQDTLASLLSQSLADLEQDTIARVEQQFATLGQSGELWVRTGLTMSERHHRTCPFCDQDIQNNTLVSAYRAYFSQEYERYVEGIAEQSRSVLDLLESTSSALSQAAVATDSRRTFWIQYIKEIPHAPDYEDIASCLEALHRQLQEAFQQKTQSPLAALDLPQSLIDSATLYVNTREHFVQQQAALVAKNVDVEKVKSDAQTGNRQQVESELRRIQAAVSRHSDEVKPLVDRLQSLQQQKTTLEADRDSKRSQLDQQRQTLFPQYEIAVNGYLRKFGADFEIVNVTPDNRGATPSVRYALKVNNTDISVETVKNTLSAGDRSTLALAYFCAILDGHQNLQDQVVILDDPFTSMDQHRAHATVQEIRSLRTKVAQLIVLSHDSIFLWKIQEPLSAQDRQNGLASLEVVTDGGWTKSSLAQWDITQQERTLYDDNHQKLRGYSVEAIGEPSAIAPLLRQVMEFFCRVAFPQEYPPGKLLGEFRSDEIQRCKKGQGLLDDLNFRELYDITDYANKFHHATNPNYEQELRNVNANGLKSYVDRVLEFTKYRKFGCN